MALTLPQVPTRLHLDGDWPGPLTIRRGWAMATARPWNDDQDGIAVRLERGSSDFLRSVATHMGTLGTGPVFSPAFYPSASRLWARAGFERFTHLDVMERPLGDSLGAPSLPADTDPEPDWDEVVEVDTRAFEGFWRMNRAGLVEAMAATPRSTVIGARRDEKLTGYALVGAQIGVSFLQRVAVASDFAGQGIGTALVRHSLRWARERGARTMILNVRPDNERARRLYDKEGFVVTGSLLHLMRFAG